MSRLHSIWLLATLFVLVALYPAAAQIPTPPAPVTSHQYSIVLQHASPQYVLKMLKWDNPANSNLPVGVDAVSESPDNKVLLVSGTDAGFEQVSSTVKDLDKVPQGIQLSLMFADVPGVRTRLTWPESGNDEFSRILSQLTRAGADCSRIADIRTDNGVAVGIRYTDLTQPVENPFAAFGGTGGIANIVQPDDFLLSPRVNTDGSITIFLQPVAYTSSSINMTRTVRSGETVVFDVTGLTAPIDSNLLWLTHARLLLCITPTILPR